MWKTRLTYLVLVLLGMILSAATKRGTTVGRNVLKSNWGRRNFSFSSSAWSRGSGEAQTATAANNFDSSFISFINYDIAVAYHPKDREESNVFMKKKHGRGNGLRSSSGEDNLVVSQERSGGYVAVGVADGVGGWSEAGYDSSAISRELCARTRAHFESAPDHNALAPKELLLKAFQDVLESPKVEIGGTTACLGILTPERELRVANLGDSWCGVFRDYKLIHETEFQTHNFNTPYQLAKIPPHIMRRAEIEGRRYIVDTPEKADEYKWNLKQGDVVMFATDGVTDNVIPQDIEIFLKDTLEKSEPEKLDLVAKKFVNEVTKVSKDSTFHSAFAQELSRLTGQNYLGGKEDDITIVLIKVT